MFCGVCNVGIAIVFYECCVFCGVCNVCAGGTRSRTPWVGRWVIKTQHYRENGGTFAFCHLFQNLSSKCGVKAEHEAGNENNIIGKYLEAESALRPVVSRKVETSCKAGGKLLCKVVKQESAGGQKGSLPLNWSSHLDINVSLRQSGKRA